MSDETGTYSGKVVKETPKALLVDFGLKEPVWVPRSLVRDSRPASKGLTDYDLPTWFAVQRGME